MSHNPIKGMVYAMPISIAFYATLAALFTHVR